MKSRIRLSKLLEIKRKLNRFIESLERDRITRGPEKKIFKATQTYFDKQGKGLIKELSKFSGRFKESNLKENVSDKELEKAFNKVSTPIAVAYSKVIIAQTGDILKDAAVRTVKNVGLGDISASVNVQTVSAIDYLEANAADLISNIDNTTRKITKRIIVDGAKAGKNYQQVAEELRQQFKIFQVGKPQQHIRGRAELISINEARTAYEVGAESSAKSIDSAGIDMLKRWVTVGDSRVSDLCAANEDAGWMGVKEVFPSGHSTPPRFPGCRCDAEYKRKSDVKQDEEFLRSLIGLDINVSVTSNI